ncbi:MAG: hypothetical protein ACLQU1_07045 [Bryobacteraceae bacterium]
MKFPSYKLPGLVVAFSLLSPVPPAFAQQTPSLQIKSFSVGPDQTLTYPNSSSGANQLQGFSDLHPTFFPQAGSGAPYLVFGSALTSLSSGNFWGAVVLQTTDLKTFTFATSLGYNLPVLTSPVPYAICNPTYDTTWDENYAGPGAVLQDPTLPAGNLIMLIDAEQHCPGGVWQSPFYITVGIARSSDNGKTWPAPESGAPSRYAVLQSPEPQPTVPHDDLGNGIPAGFIDKSASGDYYLYVAYTSFPGSGTSRVARAQLGADPLTFMKWYNGSFSQPGIGGLDSAVTPSAPGCASEYPENPEISYNDDLGLYLMIFKCLSGTADAGVGGLYYSTATSLDLEDWTTPQLIQNSQYPWASCTPPPGQEFDGHLPSTLSPGAAPGHTKLTGYIFLTNKTCDLASRQFLSRTFTIVAEPASPVISLVANAEGESPTIAPNTWVEVKGSNLAPGGDARIWQGSDFVNNQMPTQLDGVSATVNGKPAYVYYISPTQVNVLTPPDALPRSVQVQVSNNAIAGAAYTAAAQTVSPSFFVFNGGPYVAAVHANGSLIGPTSLYPGSTMPAKPGETVVLYANGFGATSTPVTGGSLTQSGTLSPLPAITIGGVAATVMFAGLVAPGEFQFNVVVPSPLANGDQPITATYNGLTTQPGTRITIQN